LEAYSELDTNHLLGTQNETFGRLAARLSQAAGAALAAAVRDFCKDGEPTKSAAVSGVLLHQTNRFFCLDEFHFVSFAVHPTGFCHTFYSSASLEEFFNLTGGKN
jgi:hypothetical protein